MAEVYCFTEQSCGKCEIADLADKAQELRPVISAGIDASTQFGPRQLHESLMGGEALIELTHKVRDIAPGRVWDVSNAVNMHVTRRCIGRTAIINEGDI